MEAKFVNYKYEEEFSGYGYTGADIHAVFRFPLFMNIKPIMFGQIKALAYSTYRDKFPVRALGFINPKGYTKATRTIAGTLIFSVFDKNMINYVIDKIYGSKKYNIVPDELPPFSIDLLFVNEHGNTNRISIIGAEIAEGNQILSIDQLYTDETYSFVAQDIVMLDKETTPVDSISNSNTNLNNSNYSPSNYELDLLAQLIYGEARGEDYLGKVAVGAVVMNRLKSKDFPDTIEEVIFQDRQFSCVQNGKLNYSYDEEDRKAAEAAFNGEDPTYGALYFYNPKLVTNPKTKKWFETLTMTVQIGNHVFLK